MLLTSGVATFMVTNPTDGVMNSLPLFIFKASAAREPMDIERAFAAATVLLVLVLVLFVIARLRRPPARPRPPRRTRSYDPRRRPAREESR